MRFVGLFVGGAAMLTVHLAVADDGERAKADTLFRTAREFVKSGRLELACPLFAESLALDPAPGTRLSSADCEERVGHLARAYVLYTELAKLPPTDARASYGRERAAALRPRIGLLLLPGPPSDAALHRVVIDGETRPGGDGALFVDAGEHQFVMELADGRSRALTVTVRAGETKAIGAAPPPPESTRTARAPDSPAEGPSAQRRSGGGTRPAGLVIGGFGIATLGLGVLGGVLVASDASIYKEHCRAGACDQEGLAAAERGRSWRWISPVALVIGSVATAVGLYFFLASSSRSSVAIGGSAENGAGMLNVRGMFF